MDKTDTTKMSKFITENTRVFFKKIPIIDNGTILHALSYGGKIIGKNNIHMWGFKLEFDTIINKTIDYLESNESILTQILYLCKHEFSCNSLILTP